MVLFTYLTYHNIKTFFKIVLKKFDLSNFVISYCHASKLFVLFAFSAILFFNSKMIFSFASYIWDICILLI